MVYPTGYEAHFRCELPSLRKPQKESVKERKLRNTQEADKARRYKEANETLRLFWLSKE